MSRKTIEHTREEIDLLLNQLRWGTLSSTLKLQYNTPQYEALAFEKRLLVALEFVCQERVTRRLKRTFKKMPPEVVDGNFDEYWNTNARQRYGSLMDQLKTCEWMCIDKPLNLIIAGSTGSGKSWIAGAFMRQACMIGIKSLYYQTDEILKELKVCRDNSNSSNKYKRLVEVPLLVLDDFLTSSINSDECDDLYHLIRDRFCKHSTIVVTNYPIAIWDKVLLATASSNSLIDRLTNYSHYIQLTEEESLRKSQGQELKQQ